MVKIDTTYIFEGPDGKASLLDLTAYGRQEDWEDSPEGWPQTSLKDGDWVRHHDKYGELVQGSDSCCGSQAGEGRA